MVHDEESPVTQELGRRVAELERARDRIRRLLALVGLAVVPLVLVAATRPREPRAVEGGEIVLRGAGGEVRARLGVGADGSASLVLFDSHGSRRVVLAAAEDGTSGIMLGGRDGVIQLMLRLAASGKVSMALADRKGRDRAELALGLDGDAELRMRGRDGKLTRLPVAALDQDASPAREGGGK